MQAGIDGREKKRGIDRRDEKERKEGRNKQTE